MMMIQNLKNRQNKGSCTTKYTNVKRSISITIRRGKNHTEIAEYGMNPHPPSDDDESYQKFLSFLHNSWEINPMDCKIER